MSTLRHEHDCPDCGYGGRGHRIGCPRTPQPALLESEHFTTVTNREGRYLVTCSCGKAIKDPTGRVTFPDYPAAYAAARAHERGEDDDGYE